MRTKGTVRGAGRGFFPGSTFLGWPFCKYQTGACPTTTEQSDNPDKAAVDPTNPLGWVKQNHLDRKIRGEDTNKLLLFLVCCSAFTQNPLSAIVKGPSGAGKSHLVNRVLDIFRRMAIVIEFSRITGAYLENMAKRDNAVQKPRKREDETRADYEERYNQYREELRKPRRIDLTGKILFIDELRGIQNAQAPKLLISEGRLRLGTVINGEPVEIEVVGTPVIITTTTLAVLEDPEFENRVIPIQIDETEEHTKEILGHEAETFADPAEDLGEYKRAKALTDFFQQLRSFKVANPFSVLIKEDYPTKNIEARRDFPKLLALSNVVTWLYQHQRRKAKKGLDVVLVTDLADIETVKALALGSLRESLAGLSKKEDELLEFAKSQVGPLTVHDFVVGTRRTVRRSEQWVRDHVKRLSDEGYLEPVEQNRKPFTWQYSTLQPESLDIKTEKWSNTILSTWADSYGYQLLPTPEKLDLGGPQGQPKPFQVSESKPESSPKSDFGEPAPSDQRTGEGQGFNEHPPKSNPSAPPADGMPPIERGRCTYCNLDNLPLRADPRGEWAVCQSCYDELLAKGRP